MRKRFNGLVALGAVLLGLVGAANAADLVAIKASGMIDVVQGNRLPKALVVVEGDRIVQIGGEAPDGARMIDLGEVTLLPGLMDLHTHLNSQLGPGSFGRVVRETPEDLAYRAAYHGRKTLLAGFTTVRDFTGPTGVALRRAVQAGIVDAPRVIPSRYPIGITGGHCDVTGLAPGILEKDWREGVADGPDEVVKAVRHQIKHGAQVIKTCATAGVLSFEEGVGAQQYSYEELKAMVDEASRHGLKVAAHAHGSEGIKAAVRAGVASIEHGSILDDEAIALMKEHGTYLVPTTYLTEAIDLDALPPPIRAKAESVIPLAHESLEKAIQAGVKIAFGTDAGVYPHGDNAKEFVSLVKRGMTPLEAIRSATLYAADLAGTPDRGILETGRLADLAAVEGNPLEDVAALQRVRFVMLGGRVVKNSRTGD